MAFPEDQQAVQHSLSVYRRIAVAFLVLTAVVAVLVFYVVFARAKVIVLSHQEDVRSDFIVDIARDPGPGEVRGDVAEVSKTVTRSFPATSSATVEARATGTVRITSTLSRAQPLVATTRLQTPDGALYRISESVTVPANGSVEVEAYADVLGAAGETADATFAIPGLNPSSQPFFTVTTIVPFTGGERMVQAVTQEDIDGAVAELRKELAPKLEATLDEKVRERGLSPDGVARAVTIDVTSQTSSAKVGAEVPEFEMTATIRATGTYFDEVQFRARIAARLKDLIGFDQSLVSVTEDPEARVIEKRDIAVGRANMRVEVRGVAILSAEAPALSPQKLVGISVSAAETYLESIDGVSSASVSTSPFWSNRMPTVADHISVEVR